MTAWQLLLLFMHVMCVCVHWIEHWTVYITFLACDMRSRVQPYTVPHVTLCQPNIFAQRWHLLMWRCRKTMWAHFFSLFNFLLVCMMYDACTCGVCVCMCVCCSVGIRNVEGIAFVSHTIWYVSKWYVIWKPHRRTHYSYVSGCVCLWVCVCEYGYIIALRCNG